MRQITGYLPRQEAEAFQVYAASLGIDKSALANLLILRELKRGRLPSLAKFLHDEPRSECVKITAHVADERTKSSFKAAAGRQGLKPGAAAAILFRAEISERWLQTSMTAI